ncbi:MAG: FAD-dependent thymidylate synthase [Gemmatimonadota bacterium]
MQTKRLTVPAAEEILGLYHPVLDHGFVSLVDYMGSDESIERAARVSYGHGTRKQSQTRGLIRYLRRHLHTTPSEMVELKFHVAMPIFVARQFVRHRTANINEYSARYSLMPLLYHRPEAGQFAKQSASNNQGRDDTPAEAAVYREAVERWDKIREAASDTYGWMLEQDIARELARIDLPVSLYTQWYWKIDLHNLIHFLTLRVDSHAQWEIQEYGRVMAGMLKRVAPLSYEAWVDYQVCGDRMSHAELEALRELLEADEAGGIRTRPGAALDSAALAEAGLSRREAAELVGKLQPADKPDFELDLSRFQPPEYFEARMAEAVPGSDDQ